MLPRRTGGTGAGGGNGAAAASGAAATAVTAEPGKDAAGVALTPAQRAALEKELLERLSKPVGGGNGDSAASPEAAAAARAVLAALKEDPHRGESRTSVGHPGSGGNPQVVAGQPNDGFAPGVKPEVYAAAMEKLAHYPAEVRETLRTAAGSAVVEIPVALIERNSYQTRVTGLDDPSLTELTESIKAQGVLEPILVRPLKQAGPTGQMYELIAGERRWLASRKAGLKRIPALVREVSNEQTMVITIIENLHRQDLNPMQHARAFRRLSDEFRLTQEEIAQRTGMSRPAVANYLRLTRLPEWVRAAIDENRLSFGHAKVLLQVPEDENVLALAKKVVAGGLSVRETELLVEDFIRPPREMPPVERKVDPNVRAAEMELERALGCRVQIKDRKGKGRIVIEYHSLEDFDRVLEALK